MTKSMKAMVLDSPNTPMRLMDMPIPEPQDHQVLLKVSACGVCRTDLHIVDGELKEPKLPLVLGHQIVGTVKKQGSKSSRFKLGERVGVPWLGKSCGKCRYCLAQQENLCEKALYTGYQLNGGFAEYCVADEDFCFSLFDSYTDVQVAPLLCGGLIGFRAYCMAGDAKRLGFYGFGSSAHILIQLAQHQGKEVFAFTRKGDHSAQDLAKKLGASWVGSSEDAPPKILDAALIFAPVGKLVTMALRSVDKGGSVICAGIYMSDIPSFPYELLYGERILRSVTNLTRDDGKKFFKAASEFCIQTHVTAYPLEKVNQALSDLRNGNVTGSAVITLNQ